MMKSFKGGKSARPVKLRPREEYLTVDEIRLVADLRIMHAKVDELYQIYKVLQERHDKTSTVHYADKVVLAEDIRKVDELYLWFVELRQQSERTRRQEMNGH
jgi:hypothetical protein